ncbi:hypothetical protein [Streptomyces mirabilis]|uniref:hypothetical protein n=1 Tax=Streptomyces mirabilis TaxID=68239 RepID=UPI0036C04440
MRELSLADELLVLAEFEVEPPSPPPFIVEDLLPLLLGARLLLQEGGFEYGLVGLGRQEVGFQGVGSLEKALTCCFMPAME